MLMWVSGFLFVSLWQGWCGLPFMALASVLIGLWTVHRRALTGEGAGGFARNGVAWLGAEELLVGALTGVPAGAAPVWPWFLGNSVPGWMGSVLLGSGLSLLAAACVPIRIPPGLLPVRGRWVRLLFAATGATALFAIGPCWVFLGLLWSGGLWSATLPQIVIARVATLSLGLVVLLYTGSFVWMLSGREPGDRLRPASAGP